MTETWFLGRMQRNREADFIHTGGASSLNAGTVLPLFMNATL